MNLSIFVKRVPKEEEGDAVATSCLSGCVATWGFSYRGKMLLEGTGVSSAPRTLLSPVPTEAGGPSVGSEGAPCGNLNLSRLGGEKQLLEHLQFFKGGNTLQIFNICVEAEASLGREVGGSASLSVRGIPL